MLADEAKELEEIEKLSEELKIKHRALVTAAIMQSAAAIESEAYEVVHHPLEGGAPPDTTLIEFLLPLAESIDKVPIPQRFNSILHLARKPLVDKGCSLYSDTQLLVTLRNEIVHYKSMYEDELEGKRFIKSLRAKSFAKPKFISPDALFFPHQALNAECASWCLQTATNFLVEFYEHLGVPQRMGRFGFKGSSMR